MTKKTCNNITHTTHSGRSPQSRQGHSEAGHSVLFWLICWKGHKCHVINQRATPSHYVHQEKLGVRSLRVSSHIVLYLNSIHVSDIYWEYGGNTPLCMYKQDMWGHGLRVLIEWVVDWIKFLLLEFNMFLLYYFTNIRYKPHLSDNQRH